MSSEARRGVIRVVANYVQVGGAFILGFLLYPLILRGMGTEALGFIGLMGSTTGITAMIREIFARVLVRELGAAYHAGEDEFRRVYNSALILGLAASGITATLYVAVILAVPLLKLSPAIAPAATGFILAKAVEAMFDVILAPFLNMLLVMERMVLFNACTLARLTPPSLAALFIVYHGSLPVEQALLVYGVVSSALLIATTLAAALILMWQEPSLIPRPRLGDRECMRSLVRQSGWNVLAVTANNMMLRLDMIIMNLFFGLKLGNAAFAIAVSISVFARRVVMGVTTGVDAITVRLSSGNQDHKLHRFMRQSTRLHGVVAFPTATVVFLLAEGIVRVWVGHRLDPSLIAPTAVLVRILTVAALLSGISEGWVRVFYGAGHIRAYAPVTFLGGLFSPVLACALILVSPTSLAFTGPAVSYLIITAVVQVVLVPVRSVALIGVSYRELISPLLRPGGAALLASAVIVPFLQIQHAWTLQLLVAAAAGYTIVYALACLILVIEKQERTDFWNAVTTRVRV